MDRGPNDQPTEAKGEHVVLSMFVYIFCFKVSATFGNFCELFRSTWFQQQQEFTNELENMEDDELNKCLPKVSFP